MRKSKIKECINKALVVYTDTGFVNTSRNICKVMEKLPVTIRKRRGYNRSITKLLILHYRSGLTNNAVRFKSFLIKIIHRAHYDDKRVCR